MNRPEDIPPEVWDKAFAAMPPVNREAYATSPFAMVLHLGFARAIMAAKAEERDACAEHLMAIAKSTPSGHENEQRGKSTYNWLAYCAGLIRKREG